MILSLANYLKPTFQKVLQVDVNQILAAVSRLISLSARAGVDVYTIADQLKSCPACPSYVGRTMTKHDTSKGKCCPDAIANALIDMYKEMKNSIFSDDIETSNVKSKVIKKNTEDKEQSVNSKKSVSCMRRRTYF